MSRLRETGLKRTVLAPFAACLLVTTAAGALLSPLGGPSVAGDGRASSLIARGFEGGVVKLDAPPAIAALDLLELDEATEAKLHDLDASPNARRDDIRTILIRIGSGPIVIGQGCEFDYSGAQACKGPARREGFRVVLVNSNPATIMTDPAFADRTYIEPVTPDAVRKIIEKRRRRARRSTRCCPRWAGRPA
jgi:hypothetical protein